MASLKQGQTTTKEDLNVYFYIGGSLSDPFYVSYTIFDSTTGTDQIIGLPERSPEFSNDVNKALKELDK